MTSRDIIDLSLYTNRRRMPKERGGSPPPPGEGAPSRLRRTRRVRAAASVPAPEPSPQDSPEEAFSFPEPPGSVWDVPVPTEEPAPLPEVAPAPAPTGGLEEVSDVAASPSAPARPAGERRRPTRMEFVAQDPGLAELNPRYHELLAADFTRGLSPDEAREFGALQRLRYSRIAALMSSPNPERLIDRARQTAAREQHSPPTRRRGSPR
jgi:hypothetical protein